MDLSALSSIDPTTIDPSKLPPMAIPLYLQGLEIAHHEMQNARITFAVALTLATWDLMSTWHMEYERIWKRKISFVSVCFVIARYWTVIGLTVQLYLTFWPSGDMDACRKIVRWSNVAPMITFMACAGMLGARVYAVWQKNKFVLAVLIALAGLEIGAQIGAFVNVKPVLLPAPVHACLPSAESQKLLWAYMASPFLFESVTFVLSLTKTISMIRTARSRVVTVLVRDQIAWFAVAALMNAGNLIAYLVIAKEKNRSLMAPICIAVVSVAACRMLLNLRGAAEETTTSMGSGSFPLSNQKSQGSYAIKTQEHVYSGQSRSQPRWDSGKASMSFETLPAGKV